MVDKRASVMEIMIVIVAVVLTSALILFLVKSGNLEVSGEEPELLNAQFLTGSDVKIEIVDLELCLYAHGTSCEYSEVFEVGESLYYQLELDAGANEVVEIEAQLDGHDGIILSTSRLWSVDGGMYIDSLVLPLDMQEGEYQLEVFVRYNGNEVAEKKLFEVVYTTNSFAPFWEDEQ